MRENELMIGDWVYSTFCDKPCKVIGIEQYESEYVNVKVTNVTGAKDINSLSFIPLTAEILEKNGYIQSLLPKGYVYKFEDDRVMTLERFVDYWVVRIYGNQIPMECRSIHELQHALRLCGIDKEIIL